METFLSIFLLWLAFNVVPHFGRNVTSVHAAPKSVCLVIYGEAFYGLAVFFGVPLCLIMKGDFDLFPGIVGFAQVARGYVIPLAILIAMIWFAVVVNLQGGGQLSRSLMIGLCLLRIASPFGIFLTLTSVSLLLLPRQARVFFERRDELHTEQ